MSDELQMLANLVKIFLQEEAPILSGNLFREIATTELVNVSDNEITFCIKAPFYDVDLWRRKGVIVYSTENLVHSLFKNYNGGITDYAMWLNNVGAFGTHNKSMHWVNRTLGEAASYVPNAIVINELELS